MLFKRFHAYIYILSTCQTIYKGAEKKGFSPKRSQIFDSKRHPLLGSSETSLPPLSDHCIHRVLQKIVYRKGKKILYATLQIEHLGAVYEQLLDYHIVWEDTAYRLSPTEKRRNSGTHYTPRILCDFIVEEAISKVLSVHASSQELLSLRICDPAMGSGAFLASACRSACLN